MLADAVDKLPTAEATERSSKMERLLLHQLLKNLRNGQNGSKIIQKYLGKTIFFLAEIAFFLEIFIFSFVAFMEFITFIEKFQK